MPRGVYLCMPCSAYLSLHIAIEQAYKEAGIVVHIKQEIPTVSDNWEIAKKLSELVELHNTPNTTYQEYGWYRKFEDKQFYRR